MNERSILAGCVGQRLYCCGYYSHGNLAPGSTSNKTSLLQDVEVEVDGDWRGIGHVWVQHADELWGARPTRGTAVYFTARVTEYSKRLDSPNADGLMSEIRYGLDRPHEVEVDERQPEPTTSRPQPVAGCDYLGLFKEAKRVADVVSVDALKAVLPHLDTITRLAQQIGGTERLLEVVALLA